MREAIGGQIALRVALRLSNVARLQAGDKPQACYLSHISDTFGPYLSEE
jgi:hypothetical protein